MKFAVTYEELYQAKRALDAIMEMRIQPQSSVKFARLRRKVSVALSDAEETRAMIVNKYAKKGDDGSILRGDGGEIVFSDKDSADSEWEQLLASETEVEAIPISVADLESILSGKSGEPIPAYMVDAILPFIVSQDE